MAERKKIAAGDRFGQLTVVAPLRDEKGRRKWRCRCDCGRITVVYPSNLTSGRTKSCGCLGERLRRRHVDLTGKRFGKVVALAPTPKRASGSVVWHCVCDCGTHFETSGRNLVRGFTTHCGCSRKQSKHARKKDLTGRRFGELTVLAPTGRRTKAGSVYWRCRCSCGKTCEVSENALVHGHTISCGHVRQQLRESVHDQLHFVDHTCVEALIRKTRRDNTSGHTGVYRRKNGRYCAKITFQGKTHYLGTYDTLAAAVAARKRGEENYHQPFLAEYYHRHAPENAEGKEGGSARGRDRSKPGHCDIKK
jgi:hypothetical protein